jgi:hypothetical protein
LAVEEVVAAEVPGAGKIPDYVKNPGNTPGFFYILDDEFSDHSGLVKSISLDSMAYTLAFYVFNT